MVMLGGEIPGAEAAGAGNPYRRMRLLNRPRPQIDHRQLEVAAVPREDLARLPRLHDQVVRLVIAFAMLDRRDPVAKIRIHRRAERHPRHQPSAADTVEHRVFFGDANRRNRRRQRRAHLHDGAVEAIGGAGQRRSHQVGAGHEAVGILMVFVDANAVEAGLGGMHQFIESPVVVLAHLRRIGQFQERRINPYGLVALLEIGR